MKTKSANFILESETAWEPAGEGVCREVMAYDGQIMLVKVKFEKGAIGNSPCSFSFPGELCG